MPHTSGVQLPGRRRVGEQSVERRGQLALRPEVLDRSDDLDAMIEVPRHQIGAAEVEAAALACFKMEDAAVLEEPAEHAPYADAVAQAGQAWTEGAHATHEQVDPSTRLGCRIELVDDLDVGQAVDLDPDPGLVPVSGGLGDVANLFDQALTKRGRCDEQLPKARRPAEPGQVVEEVGAPISSSAVKRPKSS